MTRGIAASLVTGLWHLGVLLELPRDMHCCHELTATDASALGGIAQCAACRQVLEVMEALRSERPS